jgi:hypothetical protein
MGPGAKSEAGPGEEFGEGALVAHLTTRDSQGCSTGCVGERREGEVGVDQTVRRDRLRDDGELAHGRPEVRLDELPEGRQSVVAAALGLHHLLEEDPEGLDEFLRAVVHDGLLTVG